MSRERAWTLLRTLARGERGALVASILTAAAWLGCGIGVPVVLGWTVQRGIVEADRSAVWIGAALLVVLGSAEAGLDAVRHRAETAASERARSRLRLAVATAAFGLDEEARDRWPAGQITARATSDADTVAGTVEALGYTLAYLASIPVVVTLLLRLDVVIAAVVVATVVVNVVATWRLSAAWEERMHTGQAALGDTIAAAQSSLEGFKVITGIGGRAGVTALFARRSATSRDRAVDVARVWLGFGPALAVISCLPTLVVLWIGGQRVIGGHADLGAVITAIGLALFLRTPVELAGNTSMTMRSTLASARRLVEIIEPTLDDGHDRGAGTDHPRPMAEATADDTQALLHVDGVTFEYPGSDRFALATVDLTAHRGQVVLITGAVGSGKSTLAALIAGARAPRSGAVRIGGRSVGELDPSSRSATVLRLGPEPFLFADTIAANVRLADPSATDAAVAEALALAHADEFVSRLDHGASTLLADRGATLSGGQRQRLALARAVLARPAVLVLDGATGGLDPEREAAVLTSIAGAWSHGVLVVVSLHPTAGELADHVVDLPAPAWHTAEDAR